MTYHYSFSWRYVVGMSPGFRPTPPVALSTIWIQVKCHNMNFAYSCKLWQNPSCTWKCYVFFCWFVFFGLLKVYDGRDVPGSWFVEMLICFFWDCWRFMMEGMKISGWWVREKTHSFGFTCLNYIQEVTQEALAQNEANGLGPKFWVWFGHICIHAFIEGCDFWSGTIWWSWVRLPWMRWSVFTAVS